MLIEQTLREHDIGVALISEPNEKIARANGWIVDRSGDITIKVRNEKLKVRKAWEDNHHSYCPVVLKSGTLLCACYASPNIEGNDFEQYLEDLKDMLRSEVTQGVVFAGDLNAKSTRWGPGGENVKGIQLCEWMEELDLEIVNCGNSPTFLRKEHG